MFVDDPKLSPSRALATRIAGTVSLSSRQDTRNVNHVSLN